MDELLPAYKSVGERRYRGTSGLYWKDFEQSRPTQGIVTVSTRGINQDGIEVMSFERTMLVHRRGHSPEEAAGY